MGHPALQLVPGLLKLLDKSLSKTTLNTYQRAIDLMQKFLVDFSISVVLPLPPVVVALFISRLHAQGYASASIITYVSAVSHIHKLYSVQDPGCSFLVKKAVAGAKKDRPQQADVRLPITPHILGRLLKALRYCARSAYEQTMFTSMFSLAFAAFLRVGEFTVSNSNVDNVLRVEDLNFCAVTGSLQIQFKSYKHSNGKPKVIVVSKRSDSGAVAALLMYLSNRGRHPGFLYVWPSGAMVTRQQFSSVLNSSLKFCDLDPQVYKSHSFRIGAACHAASLGHSATQIRAMGRWNSDAFLKYIRF